MTAKAKEKSELPPVARKKARVLVDCVVGKCNQVIEGDAGVIRALVLSGLVDDDESAVAFAETLIP